MSNFNPTPAELALTSSLFSLADPQKLGIVTGDTAVKVLSGANLSHIVLGEVWAIADKENNGFLTRKGVATALRLIGYAQRGEPINEALLNKPGPLAHIDGLATPATAGSPTPPSPVPKSPPLNQSASLPPLTQQDKAKFIKLFIGCSPVNGLLSGEKARDVFVKSKLPYEKLSQIWTLADTRARGALDTTDFVIGMYLIQACMSSNSFTLPATLPSWIYDQAAQKDANVVVANHATGGTATGFGSPLHGSSELQKQYTGSSIAVIGSSTIKPQYTGQAPKLSPIQRQTSSAIQNSPSTIQAAGAPFVVQTQTQHWDVSTEAKSSSDQFFDNLDTQRRGYIEGDVAVPFMLVSKLPGEELARIWDLADLHKDGRLTRDGFAVAMNLINSRLAGAEIPTILPPSLVPPSMRLPQPSPAMVPVDDAPQLDLLGDDTPPSSAVQPHPTLGSTPRPAAHVTVSTHNTGQGVSHNAIPQGPQPATTLPVVNQDLLGDDDDEPSKSNAVPDDSAEIGNLQNQVASTSRSHLTARAERISVEHAVTQQASHLSQLQTQLSAAKASYETESRLLGTLRERLATLRTEIQSTQEELIRAESNLSATKVEKAEAEGSLLRDKEEIRDLQRKMRDVAEETDGLKSAIDKTRKDARQQKGLLAIAKKQLATAEAEKLKLGKELEISQREFEVAQKENEDLGAHIADLEVPTSSSEPTRRDHDASPSPSTAAAVTALPDSPQVVTPLPPASRQSTNPFERLNMLSGSTHFPGLLPSAETVMSEQPAISSDPFGFSIAPTDTSVDQLVPSVLAPLSPDDVGTPKPNTVPLVAMDIGSSTSTHSPSDNNVVFFTPPSTASPADLETTNHQTSEEQTIPGTFPASDGVLKPLQEMENDDSDTSDSNEEPSGATLSVIAAEKTSPDVTSPPAVSSDPQEAGLLSSVPPTFDDSYVSPVELTTPVEAPKTSPPTSGTSSPRRSRSPVGAISTRTLSSQSASGPLDPFIAATFSQTPLEPPAGENAPPPTIETVLEPSGAQMNISNINDFDEALGKMPGSMTDSAPAFKFASTFDDNFDFASAMNGNTDVTLSPTKENGFGAPQPITMTSFRPVSPVSAPTIQPPAAPVSPVSTVEAGVTSFGDAFTPQSPAASPMNGISSPFDAAFGLNAAEQPHVKGQPAASNGNVLPLDNGNAIGDALQGPPPSRNPFPPPSSPPPPPRQPSPPPPMRETSPSIRPASPQQRRVSSVKHRTPSPPPPRTTSPRLRALSGSKGSPENKPEGPSRHRLSIRFPFGRKDKTKDKEDKRAQSQAHQLPEQQQFLSPVVDSSTPVSPAVEDDAEPVKQLTAMGFSRTQSIAALETHGYDVAKALNSLLGAA